MYLVLTAGRHIHYFTERRPQLAMMTMLTVLDLQKAAVNIMCLMNQTRIWRLFCHSFEVTWRAYKRMEVSWKEWGMRLQVRKLP